MSLHLVYDRLIFKLKGRQKNLTERASQKVLVYKIVAAESESKVNIKRQFQYKT